MDQKFLITMRQKGREKEILTQMKNISRVENTYAVLSRNFICRDLGAFSVVIFPFFNGNSNIFATFIFNRKAIDRKDKLSMEENIKLIEENRYG